MARRSIGLNLSDYNQHDSPYVFGEADTERHRRNAGHAERTDAHQLLSRRIHDIQALKILMKP
jgi:hypothetical protein